MEQTNTVSQALVSLITLTMLAYSLCQNPQIMENIFQMPLAVITAQQPKDSCDNISC